MRLLFLLLALALPVFAQPSKQIVVEAGSAADSEGALRMVPPLGHTGGLFAAVLSPRGDLMLTAGGDYAARLWDVASGREVRVLPLKSYASSAAFSPDGKRALVGCNDAGILYLWDVESGRVLREMKHPYGIKSIAFSADGRQALSGCEDGKVRLWNLESGEQMRVMETDPAKSTTALSTTRAVAWSADGQRAIGAAVDGRIIGYDIETGKLLTSRKIEFDPLALRRDGKFLVGSVPDNVLIWDVDAARETARFDAPDFICTAGALSPDGKMVATGSDMGDLRVWEVATKRLVASWRGHKDSVFGLSFSNDNASLVSAGFDKIAQMWSIADLSNAARRSVRAFRGYSLLIKKLLISPDGRSMLARTDSYSPTDDGTNILQLSDIATGRRLRRWQVPGTPNAVAWSRDSRRVLVSAGDLDHASRLWLFDTTSDQPVREYKGFTHGIHALAFSPDGRQFLGGGDDMILHLWNLDAALPIANMEGAGKNIVNVMWSNDGQRAISLDDGGMARVWDIAARRPVKQWSFAKPDAQGYLSTLGQTIFSADGRFLLSSAETEPFIYEGQERSRPVLRLYDVENGIFVRELGKRNYAFEFSGDNKWVFNQAPQGRITQVWDVQSGREVTGSDAAKKLSFIVQNNGSIALRELQSGKTLLTYLAMENGDWMAFTPDGLFDGSPGGIERVTFEQNGKTYALEQFAERFYCPGLVRQIMQGAEGDNAGAATPEASAGALLAQGAPPVVKITSPQTGAAPGAQIEVTVQATAQNNGGIKAIRLYQNGRLVGGPGQLRGIVVEAAAVPAAPINGALTQKFSVLLAPGENALRAVAYSQTDLESKSDEVRISFASATQKPALHVVAIGINAYRDATMNLTYARPDAESLVQFFKDAKNTTLFSSSNVTALMDEAATGEAIKKALADVAAQAKPEDVVFLYMAGHGETAAPDEAGDDDPNAPQNFYFLPYEMRQMVMKKRVREFGLSGAEINALISKIPARKVVLVYDACKSGAAVDNATRGAGDEQQALAQLARAQGIFVLTASTAQQYAGEVKALGHGILTYALLEGLGGKAAGSDSLVKVNGLFAYTDDRVPALAKEFRGREQWPVTFGKGQNFPIVRK